MKTKNYLFLAFSFLFLLLLLVNTSCSQAPKYKELTFQVKTSDLGYKNHESVKDKKPDDLVNVSLKGNIFDPPKETKIIPKNKVNRNNPLNSSDSVFSANKASDLNWIIENFTDEEQPKIKSILGDGQILQRNQEALSKLKKEYITGEAIYKNYVLLFTRHDYGEGKGINIPVVYKKTNKGWKQTNALAQDKVYDIVFSALNSGTVSVE